MFCSPIWIFNLFSIFRPFWCTQCTLRRNGKSMALLRCPPSSWMAFIIRRLLLRRILTATTHWPRVPEQAGAWFSTEFCLCVESCHLWVSQVISEGPKVKVQKMSLVHNQLVFLVFYLLMNRWNRNARYWNWRHISLGWRYFPDSGYPARNEESPDLTLLYFGLGPNIWPSGQDRRVKLDNKCPSRRPVMNDGIRQQPAGIPAYSEN